MRDHEVCNTTLSFTMETLEGRRLLSVNWGTVPRLIHQDQAVTDFPKITGKGQTVAVIDTGVAYNHPALGGGWGRKVIGGWDFVNNNGNPTDPSAHGTLVAGIIAGNRFQFGGRTYQGIAPGAKIISLRVEDTAGNDSPTRIEAALKWVIANRNRYNITAVNMSLGDGYYTKKVSRQPYGDELATLDRMGVFIAAASGNDGLRNPAGVEYPAADPHVMAVGSVTPWGRISSFTSRGPDLNLLAPGENVPGPIYDPTNNTNIYVAGSGTSFAAPFAVGAAVLMRQVNSRLTNAQITSILEKSGTPVKDSGGTGLVFSRINIDAALKMASATRVKRHAVARV
ncbi:MAG: S8 family peptidase [Bacillota bacterium]